MNKLALLFIGSRFIFGRRSAAIPQDLARKAVRGAILSVAISLVPLIIVMQVSSGMIQGITARYIELGTYHLQLWQGSNNLRQQALVDELRLKPEIHGAWQEARSAGVVFVGGKQEGVAIRALEPSYLQDERTLQYLELKAGSLTLDQPVDALIGSALAEKLGLSVGQAINLITLRNIGSGQTMPRISIFIIRGIISAGYRELDAHWLCIPYASASRVMELSTSDTFIGIKVADPYSDAPAIKSHLLQTLTPGSRLHTWQELERNLFASLANTQLMLLLIMAITVIVAAVNITSALSTMTLERAHEIAILKCMGAKAADMRLLFSVTGACLGALGSILGSAGGILLSSHVNSIIIAIEKTLNVLRSPFASSTNGLINDSIRLLEPTYYLESIPIDIKFSSIAAIIVTSIIVSFFAALLPARKAARLIPLDIFRKHN
ncbi:MAG: FtsX-like permease family protein [Spirochaetes bacterium]|nr:FtsX-like permease family protein [Spirochaetota bacterium]